MSQNILPDCRLDHPVGSVFQAGNWWVPIYCANCGADGGLVPEDTNFIFWLCNDCFAYCGEITNTYVMPDEVFWEKVKNEQLEAHGRFLNEQELMKVIEEDSSPLATLIKQQN